MLAPLHLVPVTYQPHSTPPLLSGKEGARGLAGRAFSRGVVASGMGSREEEGLQRGGSGLE